MARTDTLNNFLTDVAESIRTKKGTTDLIPASNFDTEIDSIETGGGDISEYFETNYESTSSANGWINNNYIKKLPEVIVADNVTSLKNFCANAGVVPKIICNSNVTNFESLYMSANKTSKIDVSGLNSSNVSNMSAMFSNCGLLEELVGIEKLDTRNLANMYNMFYSTYFETLDISNFDMSKVTRINNCFNGMSRLENLTFGRNLGAEYSTTSSANYSYYRVNLSNSYDLTEVSLISVLNGLYDIKTKGCQPQQCTLGSTNLAKLTSEAGQQALAQATSYGWTIS